MDADHENDPESRLESVRRRIGAECARTGRSEDEVGLLAVSKGQPASLIRELAGLGHRAFGESYLDEAEGKMDELAGLDLEWHFIAPVQSNKTKTIAARFDWVQSVDRAKIIRRLNDQRPEDPGRLNVCIQVNVDAEPQKSGCRPEELPELADAVAGAPRLRLRGIMAIPAHRTDTADQLAVFERLAELYRDLKSRHPDIDTLSAGMSGDLEAAIQAGSTMVRVGTALFGPRD